MIYLFLFAFLLIFLGFLFHFLTKKYINPYKLYLFFGKKGCGKSTLLQKLVVYYKKLGYTCYCNIGDSDLNDVIPIHIDDLPQLSKAFKNPKEKDPLIRKYYKQYIDPNFDVKKGVLPSQIKLPVPVSVKPHSVIFCDEINLLWDNRDFKSFPKDMQHYFRLQRHYKHIFIGFSQTYDCDKKIRDLADELIIVRRIARVWIRTKSYIKKVVVISPEDENNRETATMTDDFIPRGLIYDLFSPFKAWLPYWVKKHDSFK